MKHRIRLQIIILYLIPFLVFNLSSCELRHVEPNEPISSVGGEAKFISGFVCDENTNLGIPGAEITIAGITVTTDENGNFDFTNELETGIYTINISKEGYFPIKRSLSIHDPQKNRSFIQGFSLIEKNTSLVVNAQNGGTITSGEGHSLEIPANALSQNTNLSITSISGSGIPILLTGTKLAYEAVALEPNGQTFQSALTLRVPISVNQDETQETIVKAISYDQITLQPESVDVILDTIAQRFAASINHFCYVIFYIDGIGYEFIEESYTDSSKSTNAVVDCRSERATADITIQSEIINNSNLPPYVIETKIGKPISFSITRKGVITRSSGGPIRQLYYKVSGIRYIIKKNDIEIVSIKYPQSIEFISKDVEPCHDQGGG
ncbi:MAG: carboxypeptidase regulatory-like domain-containing protein [Bacteroidota bacterium]